MRMSALLSLALPLLLGSCAPLASLLATREAEGPAPRRAGPLTVGQTWTVSGRVDTREVTATVNIPDLVDAGNTSASVSAREQYDAFTASRPGFAVADFDQPRRVARFRWVGETQGTSYTCRIENVYSGSQSLSGVLVFERSGLAVATGTCTATVSQTP